MDDKCRCKPGRAKSATTCLLSPGPGSTGTGPLSARSVKPSLSAAARIRRANGVRCVGFGGISPGRL